MSSKKNKRACPFSSSTPRRKKTTKSFSKEWASILAGSDKDSYYNQDKCLKDDRASEKPIETTAESVAFFLRPKKKQTGACHAGFLATDRRIVAKVKGRSRASFLGGEAAKRAMKSREVPCHLKIGLTGLFWKSIVAGEKLQEKTRGSGMLSILPGNILGDPGADSWGEGKSKRAEKHGTKNKCPLSRSKNLTSAQGA